MPIGYPQPQYPYNYAPNPNYGIGAPMSQQPVPQQNTQQSSPLISVDSREEAFYWLITPGNSLIFRKKDGSAMYTKTVGYSAAEPPIFEEFIKVTAEPVQNEEEPDYKSEFDKIWGEINALKNRQSNKPQNNKRREDGANRDV